MPNYRNRNRNRKPPPSRVRARARVRVSASACNTLFFLLFPLDCTCNAYAMLVHSIRIPRRAGFRTRRPRPCRHHRRKRGVNARHCVRPRRTGSRPSRRAVRLQGRLTPFESVRQFRPMSAGKDSGKPRNRSTAPEASGLSAVRKSPPSNAGTPRRRIPANVSERRKRATVPPFDRVPRPASDDSGNRSTVATVRACQRFRRARIPATVRRLSAGKPWRTSNAGKPSGFRSKAATVRPCRKRPRLSAVRKFRQAAPPDSATVRPLAGSSPRLSANAGTRASRPPVYPATSNAATVRACQRFGSRHHRKRRPCARSERRHHRRKRGANARHCVRPCRTGSRPSRHAVRLQSRLTPPDSPPSNTPPDSGKPSGLSAIPATVCRVRPVSGSTVANIGTPPDSPQPFAASRFR